jgi:diguanylate cyclase (GGDEF)-like protein/PAS domain S-box-containing protein
MRTIWNALFARASDALPVSFGLLLALLLIVGVLGLTAIAMEQVIEPSPHARRILVLIAALGGLGVAGGIIIAILTTRQVRRSESALEAVGDLAEATLHSIGDGVITVDSTGRVEYLNPVAERYTGWSISEARGRPLADVFHVIDERTAQPLASLRQAASEGLEIAPMRLVGRSGRECAIRCSCAAIQSRSGKPHGMIVVFHDISQIQTMASQLLWQASHDVLTGLVNRHELEQRLADLIETARTQGREHALMFMDLDNFKAVNDTCGHDAGDELLRQLTQVMLGRMRGSDTLARFGGDDFAALLESCPPDQALRIANAVRESVRDYRFVWQDKTFSVSISIGLVLIDAQSGDAKQVLGLADASCYEAKSKGRDRVQVYRPQVRDGGGRRSELDVVSQISQAFESGRFRLYRQRIVPLNAALRHERRYEVLVRMLDSSGTLVPPSGFMSAAERYNLLTSIERWVISELIEYLHRRWRSGPVARAHDFPHGGLGHYAVNVSGASVNDRSFPDFLRNLLTRYELPDGVLCFEITETTAIANLEKAAELMHEFKGMGCRFALDDFGTGMSSFAYLKHLPVDYLKIAGMFVKDMMNDPMDHAIVEAINRISHILGMQTVAESVEDVLTLERVTALGVDFAQGYFVAKPEALADDDSTEEAVLQPA